VSRAINRHFSKTFSELVLAYRLKRAAQLLLAQDSKLYTVEAIAFESGFNTLSAFYAAFKRHYHTTPAQFRAAAANPAPPA
jgi:AraC-like DNA-binding protein